MRGLLIKKIYNLLIQEVHKNNFSYGGEYLAYVAKAVSGNNKLWTGRMRELFIMSKEYFFLSREIVAYGRPWPTVTILALSVMMIQIFITSQIAVNLPCVPIITVDPNVATISRMRVKSPPVVIVTTCETMYNSRHCSAAA